VRVLEPPDGTFAPAAGQQSLEPTPLLDAPGAFEPSSFDPASPLDSANPAAQLAAAPIPGLLSPHSYPLVLVHWLDAWYDPDEQSHEDWRADYPVQTVGYLVRDDHTVISIAQEVLPDDEGFRAVTHIPRAMVQQITRLALELPSDGPSARPA
jgi:hypothetical protein